MKKMAKNVKKTMELQTTAVRRCNSIVGKRNSSRAAQK
jgi:hypothetical protein